jgi:adenosylhomocysteine nucleosidase
MQRCLSKARIFFLTFIISALGLFFSAVANAQPQQSALIAIVNPMPPEGSPILNLMTNKKTIKIEQITYTLGTLEGKQVIQVFSGIGKVNTAIVTTQLIAHFHPKIIFLVGIAGEVTKNAVIGSVVIGQAVYPVERDFSHPTTKIQRLENINPLTGQQTPAIFKADPALIQIARNIKIKDFNEVIGEIATSDDFPDPKSVISNLTSNHATAIEMEGASFMQVCWVFKTPCLVIRGISDTVSKNELQGYTIPENPEQLAITNSVQYLIALLKYL